MDRDTHNVCAHCGPDFDAKSCSMLFKKIKRRGTNFADFKVTSNKEFLGCRSGARFTKHLKLKIFVSSIQFVELTKILGLRCLVKRAPVL